MATKTKITSERPRKLKTGKYKSFKLQKRIKNPRPKLPSAWKLFKQTTALLRGNWQLFFGISLIYGVLLFVFVRSVGGGVDVAGLKSTLSDLSGGGNNLNNSFALFGILLSGSATNNNEVIALYQTIITIVTSLALLWSIRQATAGGDKKITAKMAFYKGMYPLIPVLLVLLVIGLELLPISFASSIYSATVGAGLAVTAIEKIFWTVFCLLLGLFSLYLIASSIFALYIAALPNMEPMKALRSARHLVLHRRFEVMRKIIYLPIILLLIAGFILIPIIAVVPGLADAIFFLMSIIVLPLILGYMYNLYRAML